MVYEGGTKGIEQRKVTPRALLYTLGHIYLAAFYHIDNTEKSFRLDRIREFHIEEQ
jgi:predicted DNA-binding transcriptional regulator YafY